MTNAILVRHANRVVMGVNILSSSGRVLIRDERQNGLIEVEASFAYCGNKILNQNDIILCLMVWVLVYVALTFNQPPKFPSIFPSFSPISLSQLDPDRPFLGQIG